MNSENPPPVYGVLFHSENKRILKALAEAGNKYNDISDLINGPNDYNHLITLLVKLLPTIRHEVSKEAVVRALAVPAARDIAQPALIDAYRDRELAHPTLYWVIGNTLYTIGDRRSYDAILELVADSRYGDSRQMLASYLGKMKDPRAVPTLLKVLHDEGMSGSVMNALGHIRDKRARKAIVPFLKHPNAWYRQQAAKAIERIDEGPKARAGAKSKGATAGKVAPKPASRRVRREK